MDSRIESAVTPKKLGQTQSATGQSEETGLDSQKAANATAQTVVVVEIEGLVGIFAVAIVAVAIVVAPTVAVPTVVALTVVALSVVALSVVALSVVALSLSLIHISEPTRPY